MAMHTVVNRTTTLTPHVHRYVQTAAIVIVTDLGWQFLPLFNDPVLVKTVLWTCC